MRRKSRPLRILDFDLESRPLGWISSDFVHSEITVAAWAWIGEAPQAKALTKDERSRLTMLKALRKCYDQADMVVGHYIRGFDLPLFNGMLVEVGEPPLARKLTQDTKSDLVRMNGISKSQKNLSEMFGIDEEKIDMSVPAWRNANRLTRDGVEKALDRAVYDVAQNIALRAVLLERGLLGPPRVWRP
jgi:hypothetical protein